MDDLRDRAMRWSALVLLPLGLASCHAGLGPTVGYRFDDDARIGWEASGGFAIARASVGQAFSYGEQADTDFYVAAEPGVLLGATLGADYASGEDWGFMPGGWIGVPVYPRPDQPTDRAYDIFGMQPMGTLAIGYRYAHGHELYLAPKFFLLQRLDFH